MSTIKMRQQFVNTITKIMNKDPSLAVLLGDIGVHGFRQIFNDHPSRIYNIGILEQSTISVASGMSMTGLIPVVHTIAPFIVERAFEQIKDDFGYQNLNGNFVSVGGSYDYAGLGCTHHCPGDIGLMLNVPNMSIIVPGTSDEFDKLFSSTYSKKIPKYFRLSEESNTLENKVTYGKANIIKRGKKAIVVVVGPMLDDVMEATKDIDVDIIYYTTIRPFDIKTLEKQVTKLKNKIIICEPYYSGAISTQIINSIKNIPISFLNIGVPYKFLNKYGTAQEHKKNLELDTQGIRKKIINFLK